MLPVLPALVLFVVAADLTPKELDTLLEERRMITDERPSLAPPIVFVGVGALGWGAAIVDMLVLGYFELGWSFNGFGRVQSTVDGMLIFAGIAAAAGVLLGVPGTILLVHRVIERAQSQGRLDEIDHELRVHSDVDPSRL